MNIRTKKRYNKMSKESSVKGMAPSLVLNLCEKDWNDKRYEKSIKELVKF